MCSNLKVHVFLCMHSSIFHAFSPVNKLSFSRLVLNPHSVSSLLPLFLHLNSDTSYRYHNGESVLRIEQGSLWRAGGRY